MSKRRVVYIEDDDGGNRRKESDYERGERVGKRLIKLGILMFVAVIVLAIVFAAVFAVTAEYQYRKAIGSYIDNAYDAATFEVMAENLQRAKQGMIEQGLSPEDCGRAFYWEQTPDYCMAYQYGYIDSLISSTQLQAAYYQGLKQNGTFNPVNYNDALNKQRAEFGRNGPADWVAEPAWMLKHYPLFYWNISAIVAAVLLPLGLVVGVIGVFKGDFL